MRSIRLSSRETGRCSGAYRHGLRAVEIADLEWARVEFGRDATLHVRPAKNGKAATHPLRGDEIRALRELRRQFPDSAFVFATERGGPFTPDAVNRLIKRIGTRASFPFQVHAHMLRHACAMRSPTLGMTPGAFKTGWAIAQSQHTTRYTEVSAAPFRDFWRD
jgi:type 1 fimbriae regulatory protein FimB/type 1 fimbriae regulatory protein FimE